MRAIVLVIDGFGIGALPDAGIYGDSSANTALHICRNFPHRGWPFLTALGLGNSAGLIGIDLPGCPEQEKPVASFGIMAEKSTGKDTTTGHWEIAGIVNEKGFGIFPPEYPSFPEKLTSDLTKLTGREIIGNKSASGTAIIEELGEEHMKTGNLICYTSADSVFQIAAEETLISPEELYSVCRTARTLCDDYNVGRIIARPFIKAPDGSFSRTSGRRDFNIALPAPSILDILNSQGVKTTAIGKIGDIFREQGISISYHDNGNEMCIKRLLSCLKEPALFREFIFVNLVDTDMLYGHRRNIQGYKECVDKIDAGLEDIADLLSEEDVLIITADHGCDPSYRGTDHTREYVPLLIYSKGNPGNNLGIKSSFSFISEYLRDFFS